MQVNDVNTQFLCQELRSIGFQVKHVAVVPDNVEVRGGSGLVTGLQDLCCTNAPAAHRC
jgi:hypothetical protein